MGLYATYVLPRFNDLAMKNKETARLRVEWLSHAFDLEGHGFLKPVHLDPNRSTARELHAISAISVKFFILYSLDMVEAAGIEPASEKARPGKTTCVVNSIFSIPELRTD